MFSKNRIKKWIKVGVLPAVLAVPILIVYGIFRPWPPAAQALSSYAGQTAVTVGLRYELVGSPGGKREIVSRSYLLFPSVLTDPKAIVVTQVNSEPVVVVESLAEFIAIAGWVVLTIFGTWWFYVRSPRTSAA